MYKNYNYLGQKSIFRRRLCDRKLQHLKSPNPASPEVLAEIDKTAKEKQFSFLTIPAYNCPLFRRDHTFLFDVAVFVYVGFAGNLSRR
jgi:hypothetical protein